MSTTTLPSPPPGALVYKHPQGKTIYVLPDGSMETWLPSGKRGSSSATPAKLAAGHGGWMLVSGATPPKPYVPPVGAEHSTRGVRLAMTYGAAEVEDLHAIAAGHNIVLEQKLDGTRCLAVITHERGKTYVRFLGRNGQQLKHATAAQHFANLAESLRTLQGHDYGEIVLDGEIMQDGTFWVFDLPYVYLNDGDHVVVRPTDTWVDRHCALVDLAEGFEGNVKLLQTALDPDTKEALIEQVESTGGEGLMLKHALSPYEAGVRVKHSLKVKYVKTADVVVLARDTGGKKNATLGVDGGARGWITMGNCSMIGKPNAKVGDVIEVKYLYLGAGGKLYQPRMERIREDREPKSCTMDQFKTYSKVVHE